MQIIATLQTLDKYYIPLIDNKLPENYKSAEV